MKTSHALIFLTLLFALNPVMAQEKSRKEQKADDKNIRLEQTAALLEEGSFMFIAYAAFPQGGQAIDMTIQTNYVKIKPELVESFMPYYGMVSAGVGFGVDAGIKFKGKPDNFTVSPTKKKVIYRMNLNNPHDTFRLTLTIMPQGDAILVITSRGRDSITYNGRIYSNQ